MNADAYVTNPEEQAFPHNTFTDKAMQGLTKREYFAVRAMQGLLITSEFQNRTAHWQADVVYNAVRLADALIDQLNHQEAHHEC